MALKLLKLNMILGFGDFEASKRYQESKNASSRLMEASKGEKGASEASFFLSCFLSPIYLVFSSYLRYITPPPPFVY